MESEHAVTVPSFSGGRTIGELMLPVVPGALHERAIPLAAALADAWQLPVRLVHVTPSISSHDPSLDATLDGIRSWYPTLDVTVEHVYGDDPAITLAQELGPRTLAVLATEHIDKWRFKESVAESFVHRAGLPVLLIGPDVTKADVRHGVLGGEVVVGLDGSQAAESALEPAVELAKALQKRLWLVHVVPEPLEGESLSAAKPGRYLQEIAERYSPLSVRWEVVQSNDPVVAIETFAARRHASFLVASTRGRTDSLHHSMASVASGLVAAAARPVLLLMSPETLTLDAGR